MLARSKAYTTNPQHNITMSGKEELTLQKKMKVRSVTRNRAMDLSLLLEEAKVHAAAGMDFVFGCPR